MGGMKLLCWYNVKTSFQLYFLAFTDESPPSAEPTALENREWTYSRPYTTLELCYKAGAGPYSVAGDGTMGWQGFTVNAGAAARARVEAAGFPFEEEEGCLIVRDPDGYPVALEAVAPS